MTDTTATHGPATSASTTTAAPAGPSVDAVTEKVRTYLAAFNEADAGRRHELADSAFAAPAYYTDPLVDTAGLDGISDFVSGVQGKFPDHHFRLASGVDVHHDRARFEWELVAPDGSVVIRGLDIAVVAPDGRLMGITGFLGPLPAAA